MLNLGHIKASNNIITLQVFTNHNYHNACAIAALAKSPASKWSAKDATSQSVQHQAVIHRTLNALLQAAVRLLYKRIQTIACAQPRVHLMRELRMENCPNVQRALNGTIWSGDRHFRFFKAC